MKRFLVILFIYPLFLKAQIEPVKQDTVVEKYLIIKGDSIFCATGITSGELVNGVKLENGKFITETLVTHKNSVINIVKKELPIT